MNEKEFVRRLVEALHLLAAPYQVQLASLPSFVPAADEIALLFDDCYSIVPELLERGAITEPQADAVRRVDAALEVMSENKSDVWSHRGMEHAPEWQAVRALASKALCMFAEAPRQPVLDWQRYDRI